MKEKEQTL